MARIPESELNRLKSEISLLHLVESFGIKLKRQGRDYLGLCPFHDDKTSSLEIVEIESGYGLKWTGERDAIMVRDIGAINTTGSAPYVWTYRVHESTHESAPVITPIGNVTKADDSAYLVEVSNTDVVASGKLTVHYVSTDQHRIGSLTVGNVADVGGAGHYQMASGWNLIGGIEAAGTTDIRSFMSDHHAASIWHWPPSP